MDGRREEGERKMEARGGWQARDGWKARGDGWRYCSRRIVWPRKDERWPDGSTQHCVRADYLSEHVELEGVASSAALARRRDRLDTCGTAVRGGAWAGPVSLDVSSEAGLRLTLTLLEACLRLGQRLREPLTPCVWRAGAPLSPYSLRAGL